MKIKRCKSEVVPDENVLLHEDGSVATNLNTQIKTDLCDLRLHPDATPQYKRETNTDHNIDPKKRRRSSSVNVLIGLHTFPYLTINILSYFTFCI